MLQLALSNPRAGIRRVALFLLLASVLLALGCDDGDGVTAPVPAAPTVTGTVVNTATGGPVAGAEVSVGTITVTTGADGRFQLAGLTTGPAKLRSTALGFEDFEMDVTVPSGTLNQDISLTPVDPSNPLQIGASLFHGAGARRDRVRASIVVLRAGESIDNATVTVNGFAIPRSSTGPGYEAVLPEALPIGSPLHVVVSARGLTVEATGNVPEAPVLTAPAEGSVFASADSIAITWTSTTDPDGFEVYAGPPDFFCCGPFISLSLPGTARELKIAASALSVDSSQLIQIWAGDEGSFTGPADPESHLAITIVGAGVNFSITP